MSLHCIYHKEATLLIGSSNKTPKTMADFENLPHVLPARNEQPDSKEVKIVALTLSEFLGMELPPKENLLDPWLRVAGLCMVYAARGIGKTYFSLEITMALAYAVPFLGFTVLKPRKVLYIDGEMPANTMQERLARIVSRMTPNSGMIEPIFITPDLQGESMPNLSTVEGQDQIKKHLEGVDLVVVDNISTLCGFGKENEATSWIPVQQWALELRRQGIAVLFVHHAGKNGTQRGTSKREDILDTVINLKRPSDYEPTMGACFELHFEKARGMVGEAIPIRCQFVENKWAYEAVEVSNYQRLVELAKAGGMSQRDIAEELELSKGQVSKLMKKAKALGDING
jgi:KaiC/GvpD/RAD55 family RecA-like ATPase